MVRAIGYLLRSEAALTRFIRDRRIPIPIELQEFQAGVPTGARREMAELLEDLLGDGGGDDGSEEATATAAGAPEPLAPQARAPSALRRFLVRTARLAA